MQIIKGKIKSAQKVIIYGPEGIGKSTMAAQFPEPLFIDTEGSTKHMDVDRLPKASSWTMLVEQVRYVKANQICKTLIVDTADWAEQLCIAEICAKHQKNGIEDFGYGKGYIYLMEEFGRLLNLLEEVIETGIHVVLTAHAKMRKFEQPDEMGAYDRWELKLQKQTAPLVKEWADMILFANYKTHVINIDGQGATKGKNKVQGGQRIMYTVHHPCWDAKNRHDLKEELPLDYNEIAHIFSIEKPIQPVTPVKEEPAQGVKEPIKAENKESVKPAREEIVTERKKEEPTRAEPPAKEEPQARTGSVLQISDKIPKSLRDLMEQHQVDEWNIQAVVAKKGYYPEDTPIENYDPAFIDGVLVGAWQQVYKMIQELPNEVPYN